VHDRQSHREMSINQSNPDSIGLNGAGDPIQFRNTSPIVIFRFNADFGDVNSIESEMNLETCDYLKVQSTIHRFVFAPWPSCNLA
jgi:hypothetical protein